MVMLHPGAVVGIDPGFRSVGWALVEGDSVLCAGVVRTEKSRARQQRVTDDNVRRAREIYRALAPVVARGVVVASEAMAVIPGRMAGAVKTGICYGVIAALTMDRPLVQVYPRELKQLVGSGGGRVSKAAVAEAVIRRTGYTHPGPAGQREHAYDAIAVALVAQQTDLARAALLGAQGAAQ